MLRFLSIWTLAALCVTTAPMLTAAELGTDDLSNTAGQSAEAVERAKQLSQERDFKARIRRDSEHALPAAGKASRSAPTGFDGTDLPKIDEQALAKARKEIKALLADPQLTTPPVASPGTGEPPPLIFISFSMPEGSLRSLLVESAKTGSPLILRGLVENSMKRTVARLGELLGLENDSGTTTEPSPSLAIDPTLFDRFGVDKVPAFVLPQDNTAPCTPEGCPVPEHLKVAGDVSLVYALGVMARDAGGTTLGERAAQWQKSLETRP